MYNVNNLNCLIDLHLHLDGAISINNAKKLAALQNISIPQDDMELKNLIQVSPSCRDLNEFLEKFAFPCSLLLSKEGIINAVSNLLDELEKQGLMYVEIRFAPLLLLDSKLSQEEITKYAIEGTKNKKVRANIILCCMRGSKRELNIETINVAKKLLNKGVVAIDLAGAEALFPNMMYADLFEYASSLNVPFTIHSGEALGSNSVDEAISFKAKRIGHGVRSFESEDTMNKLCKNNITLELCPTSNLNTCVFKNINEYPIRKYLEKGIKVTVNTDDMAISGITLKDEFNLLIQTFNLTKDEVEHLLINAVNASFASDDMKKWMLEQIENEMGDH